MMSEQEKRLQRVTIGPFPDHKIAELTEMITDTICDYAPVNGMHFATVIGILDNIKHQLNKDIEED